MSLISFGLQKMSTVDWLSKRIHVFGIPILDWKKVNISASTPLLSFGFDPPALLLVFNPLLLFWSLLLFCNWGILGSSHNVSAGYSSNIWYLIGHVEIYHVVQNLHHHYHEICVGYPLLVGFLYSR